MPASRGLVDTNVVVLRAWIDPAELPDELAISAVTLAELSAGPHAVTGNDADARRERARRTAVLQWAESQFDPLPFDAEAARWYGQIYGAVVIAGRAPRRRVADLQIAAVAAANGLALYTTNPHDYLGLDPLVSIVAVTRPYVAP